MTDKVNGVGNGTNSAFTNGASNNGTDVKYMKSLDVNNDGKVDQNDVVELSNKTDLNGDGVIDKTDSALAEQMKKF